jgi:N-acetylglucosamine-6-phosphate deacetylase
VRCDTLYTPHQKHAGCLIEIERGRILRIVPAGAAGIPALEGALHVPGAIVAPGFVDIHVHGASGGDFMDGSLASLQAMSATLARHGTTSFLATTMSSTDAALESALRAFAANRHELAGGASVLGIHMEGPYLNPVCRGTQDAACLKRASVAEFLRFFAASGDTIRRLTIAPEMDEGLEVIRTAVSLGVRVSLGHTDATEAAARAAVDAGAVQATHTFNAMRPFHQREPGVLGVCLADERVDAEVIADLVHVHPTALRILLRAKGADHMPLATDGLSAVGMPDGRYPLGEKFIVVRDGVCRDDDGRLAGSTLTLDRAVRNLAGLAGVSLQDAITAATAAPARSMGLEGKGVLAPGSDADLVVLSQDLQVLHTIAGGRIVCSRETPGQPVRDS